MKAFSKYILVALLLIGGCRQKASPETREGYADAPAMLQAFYTKYIAEFDSPAFSETSLRNIRAAFSTTILMQKLKLEELDYDPFINAQDIDPSWLKTMVITPTGKVNQFKVCFTNSYDIKQNCITIDVVAEGNTWKINGLQ